MDDRGLNEPLYAELRQMVNAAKNVRSHLSSFTAVSSTKGTVYAGTLPISGALCTVGPYVPSDVSTPLAMRAGACTSTYQTIVVRSLA